MKRNEIKIIIDKIRANYPNTNFSAGIIDEWVNTLEQYDYEDVSRELDDFLKANYTFAPRLNELTYHLKTIQEKEKDYIYYVRCNLCGREFKLDELDKHQEKCILVHGIVGMYKEKGVKKPYEEFERESYENLNNKYGKWFEEQRNITKQWITKRI